MGTILWFPSPNHPCTDGQRGEPKFMKLAKVSHQRSCPSWDDILMSRKIRPMGAIHLRCLRNSTMPTHSFCPLMLGQVTKAEVPATHINIDEDMGARWGPHMKTYKKAHGGTQGDT